jgi:elongation factor 1-gamma
MYFLLVAITRLPLFFSTAKAQADLGAALAILQAYLNDKTYLVNDQITLADITLACTLLYPFKLVCDKAFLKDYGNVVRWFQTCVNQPEFTKVVGKVEMCKKSLAGAAAGGGKKKGGEKKAKKEKVVEEDPEPVPVKKAEHPYKIMDKEAPSPFNMDTWKKTYSNVKNYDESMGYFWENFDQEGWTLWLQKYNFNEENKRAFMTANAVTGFQQRSDEVRKWAFGVMDVLGTEETSLEIKGIWLLRGDTVDHMKAANDDANWYTWTMLAGKGLAPTDEVKAQVRGYWTEENELEGKPIQDSKVFK